MVYELDSILLCNGVPCSHRIILSARSLHGFFGWFFGVIAWKMLLLENLITEIWVFSLFWFLAFCFFLIEFWMSVWGFVKRWGSNYWRSRKMSGNERKTMNVRDLVEEAKKRIVFLVVCVVGLSYLMSCKWLFAHPFLILSFFWFLLILFSFMLVFGNWIRGIRGSVMCVR